MLRFYAGLVLAVANDIHAFENLAFQGAWVRWNVDAMRKCLRGTRDHMHELGLPVSARAAHRFLELVEESARIEAAKVRQSSAERWLSWLKGPSQAIEPRVFVEHAKVLNNALRDELAHVLALAIPLEKARYYLQEQPLFGDAVAKQFPSLVYEIQECGKCYALGRSTASAFHAIRCLEASIAAMSRCLGIPDPSKGSERSWGRLLGAIQKKIDTKWPTSADRFSGDGRVFEDVLAVLSAIQNPYRNATMHLENKYTDDEALDIMSAVRRLMVTVANRMDENGDPKAA